MIDLERETFPPLMRSEAERAKRRIYHKFAGIAGKTAKARLLGTRCSRAWVSSTTSSTEGVMFGWGRMIRDCAYNIFESAYQHFDAANAISTDTALRTKTIERIRERAQLERDIYQFAKDKGYLNGALRPKLKVMTIEARRARYQANLRRWQTKHKRATNAIKKLQRALRRLDRRESEARTEQEAKLL